MEISVQVFTPDSALSKVLESKTHRRRNIAVAGTYYILLPDIFFYLSDVRYIAGKIVSDFLAITINWQHVLCIFYGLNSHQDSNNFLSIEFRLPIKLV